MSESALRLFVGGSGDAALVWIPVLNSQGRYEQWLPHVLIEQAKSLMAERPDLQFGDPVLTHIEKGGLKRGLPEDSGYLVIYPVLLHDQEGNPS